MTYNKSEAFTKSNNMDNISLETLRSLVTEEQVTDSELDVLYCVLQGKSLEDIKNLLNISTANALRKRLGQIYAKFRISGKGPGKLDKLTSILQDRLQAKQGQKKVLFSWSGRDGKRLAEALSQILTHPKIDGLVLKNDMSSTSLWLKEVKPLLAMADGALLCLTGEICEAPWVNLAAGFLFPQLSHFTLINFSNKLLPDSLLSFPLVDGTNQAHLPKLLHEMVGSELDLDKAKSLIESNLLKVEGWKTMVEEVLQGRVTQTKAILAAGRQMLRDSEQFHSNELFRQLIVGFLKDVDHWVEQVPESKNCFSLPVELYPRYLIYLQAKSELKPLVKAVTIVDDVERFWSTEFGSEIASTTNQKSERLFVFPDEAKFNKNAKILLEHSSSYNVYVTTLDTYLPLAVNLSSDSQFYQEQGNYALPTYQYGIISANGSKLLVWYDKDGLRKGIDSSQANFSAIPEQIKLYDRMFDQLKQQQGIFRFDVSKEGSISNHKLDEIKQGLFNPSFHGPQRPIPRELLEKLLEIRTELLGLVDKERIIQRGLEIVREELHCQTAAVFLFGKDGRLHREKIFGVDANGDLIKNDWFADENYGQGDSLTGKAVVPKKGRKYRYAVLPKTVGKLGYREPLYGEPQLMNGLEGVELDSESKKKYSDQLGMISCAMAVPLNGQNRTFGVLEAVNKVDPQTRRPVHYCSFDPDETYLLAAIGSSVANAISNYRRDKQEKLYTNLAEFLINPPQEPRDVYKKVADSLVSENTSFAACIIRKLDKEGYLEVKAVNDEETEEARVDWSKRINLPIHKDKNFLICQVVASGKPKIIRRIEPEIDKFTNREWINVNDFKAFACFPLIHNNFVVGTLSVYAKYSYHFYPSSYRFLETIAKLVSAFVVRNKR